MTEEAISDVLQAGRAQDRDDHARKRRVLGQADHTRHEQRVDHGHGQISDEQWYPEVAHHVPGTAQARWVGRAAKQQIDEPAQGTQPGGGEQVEDDDDPLPDERRRQEGDSPDQACAQGTHESE